jgi:DivIVA domain-containing protein
MGREDSSTGMTAAMPSGLTPIDIQQKEFRVSRFGGYKMRDVDEFLDQITDSFAGLSAEVERLRAGAGAPVVGAPDLDDVSRQADEIIARARAEAARIAAEARAAAPPAPSVTPADPQDRAAVSAFISKERAFLQSLAGLVQEHAETVKGMAKSSRPEPAPASAAGVSTPSTTSSGSRAAEARATEAPRASTSHDEGIADVATDRPEPTRVPDSEPTVRVDEPATAGATRGDAEPEGDRSLRELFWGED